MMHFWRRGRTAVDAATIPTTPTSADVKRAYERGRRDERARHRGHPLLALTVFVIALAGAAMIFLAAREGSFSRGGQVVDQKLAVATGKAQAAGEDATVAAADAGQSLQQRTLRR